MRELIKFDIQIDGIEYVVHSKTMTGAEIKNLAHVPPANLLYRVEGTRRVQVADNETVHLHNDEKFVTAPPVGGTS
jgi:hypothetical protein